MISQQFSLFDTATVVKPTYKIGDFVKVKRRTPHAPLLKKGDIVQIETIHPHNGSCKFWNERTESWGFLYSDEFVLIPPPAGHDDSVTPVEPVVTEYTVPVGHDDSVTPVEPVVTEYTVPVGHDDSLALNAISTYEPRGTARSGQYFRLSYRDGARVRHIHIPGGNTDSPIAQAKVAEVRSLLAAGIHPSEIAAMLRNQPKPIIKSLAGKFATSTAAE
jgi:hypothetical protein